MAKRKITPQFRARFSEKLMELGNLIAITMVIGQFVASKEFSIPIISVGAIITILCYIIAYLVSK